MPRSRGSVQESGGGPSLPLTSAEKARLARALGVDPADDSFAARLEALNRLALKEWVDWILAKRRFESVSALERERLLQIFAELRREAPTTEALVDQFDISESRAVSLLSRMRFGAARRIRALRYESAKQELEKQLSSGDKDDGQTYVWVSRDAGRLIDEANTAIMIDQQAKRAGGKYEGAVKANRVERTGTGQAWEATDKMWGYILDWLEEQATSLAAEAPGE